MNLDEIESLSYNNFIEEPKDNFLLNIKRLKTKDERKHNQLIEIATRLLKRSQLHYYIYNDRSWAVVNNHKEPYWKKQYISNCNPVYKETQNITGYLPDVIGWSWIDSVVIECKTSKSDFNNEKKKKGFRAGDIFYYLSYKDIISIDELNEYEGLLEYDQNTGDVYQTKIPKIRKEKNNECEIAILLSILRGNNRNSIT